jgi:hypothetical protein
MSIKRYKDIASMQNPGKQRTGKAGGGRVRANEGKFFDRKLGKFIKREAGEAWDEATKEGAGRRIGGDVAGLPGKIIGGLAERGVRRITGRLSKRAQRREEAAAAAAAAKLKREEEKKKEAPKPKARGGRISRAKGGKAKR